MFHMMNEARIGVGMGATVLGYTGYLHALEYAPTRTQGRPPASKDPSPPAVPDHRARRRAPDAAGGEVLRRGRHGPGPVLRPPGRRGADRRDRGGAGAGTPAARRPHPHRQGLAVAVGPGG